MNLFRRLSFELWYLRHPPWESGMIPPEVADYIAKHPPGLALDLGCGSGTSSLALARAGWSVCGVDFSTRAIRMARKKAQRAGLRIDFQVGDVTRLPKAVRNTSYELVLDIGCFHGLNSHARRSYLACLNRLLAPGGSWLLYGFFQPEESPLPGWMVEGSQAPGEMWELTWRRDGLEKNYRPSAWFCYQAGKSR